jgi:hypothetical protein
MADIFISHSMRDRHATLPPAAFLVGQGQSVWWDETPLRGYSPHDMSVAELANAALIIVSWSKASITAPYVLRARSLPRRGEAPAHDDLGHCQNKCRYGPEIKT